MIIINKKILIVIKSRKKAEPFKDNQFFPEENKELLSPKKKGLIEVKDLPASV